MEFPFLVDGLSLFGPQVFVPGIRRAPARVTSALERGTRVPWNEEREEGFTTAGTDRGGVDIQNPCQALL